MLGNLINRLLASMRTPQHRGSFEDASRLYAQNRFSEASQLCQALIAAAPASIEAWQLYALCRLALNDCAAAFEGLQTALALAPDNADLNMTMAVVCRRTDRDARAIEHCRKALAARPDLAAARIMLAQLLEHDGDADSAIAEYERAIALQPGLRELRERLFLLYHDHGRNAEADAQIAAMTRLWPNDGLRIRAAVRVPGFCDSVPAMLELRAALMQRIETLLAQGPLNVADPVRDIALTPFSLAYHGMNDRELMTAIARLIRSAYPGRPPRRGGPRRAGRLRIGFVSRHFYSHSIGRLNHGTIARLPRDKFEVTVYALESHADPLADAIRNAADRYVDCGAMTLRETEDVVAQQDQDVLFYADIGMEPRSYFLAFSRLAPVQCVTWGHPDTTGIDTIDHFISGEALETADADEHYAENLVRVKSFFLGDYAKPALNRTAKSPEHYGIKPGRNVYLCPQSLFKLHPDFDAAMAAILRSDGGGEIVLLEGAQRHWGEHLRRRFARSMPDVAARVRFLPRMPWHDLLALTAHADVVLDTFHFGGGNTTYEALAMGTPVVTLPAAYLRGRFTLGCYRRMELMDCVTDTPAAFVECATRLARDKAWRSEVKRKISGAADTLFYQQESISELAEFLERAVAAAR
jgi:protein O-GlcNAc transferase